MIIEPKFFLNSNGSEVLPLDRDGAQYICKHATLRYPSDPGFSWHWHSAFEIDYIVQGELELKTTAGSQRIRKGEAFFVNSNVVHDIQVSDMSCECEVYAHLFTPRFISGTLHSDIGQKYLIPILKNSDFPLYVIRPDHYEAIQMMEHLIRMIHLCKEEPFGYELQIRSELSGFWCLFLQETSKLRAAHADTNPADNERLKTMISYIQEHYMEKLSLEMIADSANVSVRECSRCFQRSIAMSPVSYLNEYRIRMVSDMLLYTKDSILSISENCGFSSGSYMGKVFFELMHCTPKEYRRRNQIVGSVNN